MHIYTLVFIDTGLFQDDIPLRLHYVCNSLCLERVVLDHSALWVVPNLLLVKEASDFDFIERHCIRCGNLTRKV